jgi:hypothetical protein
VKRDVAEDSCAGTESSRQPVRRATSVLTEAQIFLFCLRSNPATTAGPSWPVAVWGL